MKKFIKKLATLKSSSDRRNKVRNNELGSEQNSLKSAKTGFSRREFLGSLGTGIAGIGLFGSNLLTTKDVLAQSASSSTASRDPIKIRAANYLKLRKRSFDTDTKKSFIKIANNFRDKAPYFEYFSKGLKHNEFGEVEPAAYKALLKAVKSGSVADFEAIFDKGFKGGAKRFKNPLAAYAFNLNTFDALQFKSLNKAPPKITDPLSSAEMVELYWMAHCRDVNFSNYSTDPTIAAACDDLSKFSSVNYIKDGAGRVNPDLVFRHTLPGCLTGPMISQLLYADIKWGPLNVPHKFKTVVSNKDYLTDFILWRFTQNGNITAIDDFDPVQRYIRNGRDLGEVIHNDRMPQHFLIAASIIQFGYGIRFNQGHPYPAYEMMDPFATFDYFHLQNILTEVSKCAMWAEFARKWIIWRKLRPEEYGGLIQNKIINNRPYNFSSSIYDSNVLDRTFTKHGTYLLPQQYPEGSPGHPAYGSGHSVVAGACATILKMWFDGDQQILSPVVPNSDGTALEAYTGPGANELTLTGEINKLAMNHSVGRMWGGVHYRSDIIEGLNLGEEIAIAYMKSIRSSFKEKFNFVFTKFNGAVTSVRN